MTTTESTPPAAAYAAPPATRIGHVHLKVSDLKHAVAFYRDLLCFELQFDLGTAAFLSFGGCHHHLAPNTWESKGGRAPGPGTNGLYHVAINYPERPDLAVALKRLVDAVWPIDGASDHTTHKAIYLRDPDGNGIELAWDRDPSVWGPFWEEGKRDPERALDRLNTPLNFDGLIAEPERPT